VKAFLAALSLALAGATLALAPLDADAQRIGRGRPAGMQRQLPPPKPAQQQPPAQQATPQNPATTAAAAPAPRRSWMGPIAGLAAGLGIAALLSHFGLGEAAANMLTLALLALVVIFVVRWLLRRMRPPTPAYAGAGAAPPLQRSMHEFSASPPVAGATALPAGFDVPAFERIAKQLFVRLQAANDAGQLDDLRKFTTPELFASLQVDLHERAGKPQRTDVVQLDAKVVDTVREGDQWIASVRFSGLIREQADAAAEPFDEVWHFVKPADDSRDWAIAGITPNT